MKIQAKKIGLALLITLFGMPVICAADASGLSGNAPLRVEDADPTKLGSTELELSALHERTGSDDSRNQLQPELKYGFAQNAHVSVSSPFLSGSAPETGSGNLGLGLFYRINQETAASWLPAFAVGIRPPRRRRATEVVQTERLRSPVITPVVQDWKDGRYKIISFHAKKARGLMARFAAVNGITGPEQLKAFDLGGYAYDAANSDDSRWMFRRRVA